MVCLTDPQLKIITTAANAVPVERRSVFLERCGAMLKVRGRFTDADVHDVTALALCGLVRTGTASTLRSSIGPTKAGDHPSKCPCGSNYQKLGGNP
jgi:hypothetical protein